MAVSVLTAKEKLKKAEELSNSRDIYGWRVSDYPEVYSVLNRILEDMKAEFRILDRYKKKYQNNIRVIILDLFIAYQTDPTMYLTYSRNASNYQPGTKYHKMYLRYQIVNNIINFLIKNEYIEHHIGYYLRERPHDSKMSRMRATNKLIHLLIDEYKVEYGMIKWDEREPTLILRDIDKNNKDFTDDSNTFQMKENLKIINKNLERHAILLYVPDIELIEIKRRMKKKDPKKGTIDFSKKFVRRIFNNDSFEKGGRFYGGFWQNIPREYRKYIRINYKEIVELDYSGLHINMLYAMNKLPVPEGDVYYLDGYSNDYIFRAFVKRMLLVMVNAAHRSAVRGVLYKAVYSKKDDLELPEELGSTEAVVLNPLMDAFENKHENIKDFFCTGKGIDLQYLDSQIAEKVLLHFSKMGYAILPLHDSFIIYQDLEEELKESMQKAFFEMFGVMTKVDLKYRSYDEMHKEGVYKEGVCDATTEELFEDASEQGRYGIYNRLLNQHRKYRAGFTRKNTQ